ncbi:RNA-dependent RNA polymerase 1 [Fusarium oxysporum f. sp. albedinis]|nr:RNA-dependent RNA polymerase 1 [Fusarium oxysporum f. sp. albedinis]
MKKLAQHVPALSLFSQVISTSVALGGSLMYLCKYFPTVMADHLRTKHNIAAAERRLVTDLLKARISSLQSPSEAPFCIERTGIFQVMSGHITSAHEKQKLQLGVRRNAMYEPVSLQAWTKSPSGGRYWIVEYGGSSTRPVGGKEVYDHLEDVFERERGRQKGFSGGELTNGAGTTRSSQTTTFTDLRLWLERTGWERTFGGIDRELLKNLTTTPCPATSHRGLILKESSNRSSDVYSDEWMISSADDERKITALLAAVDMVMDRCEQTARTISRSLLCWLRSIRPHGCYAKPFTFVRKAASRRKYICLLKRFVALVFRAYRLPADIR